MLIHFTHGGLLVAGFFATLLLAAAAAPQGIRPYGLLRPADASEAGRLDKRDAASSLPEATMPTPGVRAIVEYLSRKYRVAATAVEPLVLTAAEAGARTGLDPLLLIAVMAIESGFNPIAESPLGAQGLMQVIPRFHRDKLDAAAGDNLLDPSVNIHIGARVLKEYILRAGSLEEGLQLYAGALGDGEGLYAAKVMAEKQRIEAAARRGRQSGV
jgi:soluble lytic murein transglycosylase-like protein